MSLKMVNLLPNRVTSETLVIVGDEDKMTSPSNATKVAQNISKSRIYRIKNCGHSMLSEKPNEVLDALISIV